MWQVDCNPFPMHHALFTWTISANRWRILSSNKSLFPPIQHRLSKWGRADACDVVRSKVGIKGGAINWTVMPLSIILGFHIVFQKIEPPRNWTQVIRVIPSDYTTRSLVHIQEHQIWKYKLDLPFSHRDKTSTRSEDRKLRKWYMLLCVCDISVLFNNLIIVMIIQKQYRL